MTSQPASEPDSTEGSIRNGNHRGDGIVDVRRCPSPAVAFKEHDHCDERGALVCIGERMVLHKMHSKDSSFVDQVGVRLMIAESCGGGMERRIRQPKIRHTMNGARVNLQDLGCNKEPFIERDVNRARVGHVVARRSRVSRCSATVWARRFAKSASIAGTCASVSSASCSSVKPRAAALALRRSTTSFGRFRVTAMRPRLEASVRRVLPGVTTSTTQRGSARRSGVPGRVRRSVEVECSQAGPSAAAVTLTSVLEQPPSATDW
jgi:hypothetical protein